MRTDGRYDGSMVSGTVAEMLARAVWTLIETIDIVLVESTDTGWVVPRFRQPGGCSCH